MGGDPGQIADTVAVRVGEAAGIDLIDDAIAPVHGRLAQRGGGSGRVGRV
jgi:hypothetical protein